MKKAKTIFLTVCLSLFGMAGHAQSLVEVFKATSLPTAQGWTELRFDNTMPWEQTAKDLLVDPGKLTAAIAGTAFKLKAEEQKDQNDFPLYSQLGYFLPRTGFSAAIGYTVEFRAKVINSPDGAFTVSALGGGKGFRLEFSNNKLTEHANVLDTVRVLSTASTTDGYHTYRVSVAPDNKVRVWRDGALLGELPLQPFKLDNILDDGGFENGKTAEEHSWNAVEAKPGTLTVSSDPAHVYSGKYGLYVNNGDFKNDFIPVKPGALYDMTAWGKLLEDFPADAGRWRDMNGWYDPAGEKSVYFVAERTNLKWKPYEKLGMEGGAHFQRFIVETITGDANNNKMAYDDLHYSERITASRIPAGAVNLFPNGDFENPCAPYFPAGDPRNDTCIVNPNNYRYSAEAYYGGLPDDDAAWFGGKGFSASHNAAPFWHPFWGARVRVQYDPQPDNSEAGPHWARGKYSLRYFNCFGHNVEYGEDFSAGQNEDRGSNSNIKTVPIELEVGQKYTFLFSYHFAKWGGDHLILVVKNGTQELFRKTINSDEHKDWVNVNLAFTTDATNHALQILTERDGGNPGVFYLDDLFLFKGELLPEDNTHIFFGKQTGMKGAEVDIEYIKIDNTGAYDPNGNAVIVPYKKGEAPLMTTWGTDLVATGPILNEYPRPQLKRDGGWTNLNGIWDYTLKNTAFGTYNATEAYRAQILVPYPAESALSGIMDPEYSTQNKAHIYKRIVTIAKPTDSKRVILNFGAIDWHSIVFINGQKVTEHKGGYDPFSVDITDKLNANGSQEIVVHAFDPTHGGQPSGKQNPKPGGTVYTPASGIWQTVWTEVVNPTYVTNVALTPVDNASVKVKVEAANATGATATVTVLDGASPVGTANVAVGTETSIAIANPKLWSPETPFLYNVKVELKKGGATTDQVTSYFGMRKVEVKTLRGTPHVYLNGKPTFSFATLDHGYFPDGIYTPASYDAMRFDLLKLKELGFNAVRKFEKIEPAIWYHLADSLGLLVWQDIPAANATSPISELSTEDARKANFLRETAAMTKSIRNFPSIIAWIGFNDGWGRYGYDHVKNTVNLFRSLNDGRLVVPESGPDTYELGDVVSSHGLPIPNMHTNAYNERASICGVTGNYNYAFEGHIWKNTLTSDIKSDSLYAARLKEFADATKTLSLAGLSGLAMVQTTDVEEEINGLMTYDRKVYKAGTKADSLLKATTAFLKTKIADPILKVGKQGGEVWKYLDGGLESITPGEGWNTNIAFDDSSWKEGLGGFGSKMNNSYPNTPWTGENKEIYLRKIVHIPALEADDKLHFSIFHDEDYQLYINGVPAASATGYITNYTSVDITPAAAAAINYGGDNLFAIYVRQTSGGSYIDLGLTTDKLSKPIDYPGETPPSPTWKDIATAEQWLDIANDLNGFYRLTADIDLFDEPYVPIGNTNAPFKGYIDGQNHTVRCPGIETPSADRVGLFGYADGAHFVNLRFTAGLVRGGADAGILLGRGKGITVSHVVFDDEGPGDEQYQNEVYGRDHVGIIAGMLEGGELSTIQDVYVVNGLVESSEWQAGGLFGIVCDTRITNAYFTGTVSITETNYLTARDRDAAGIASRTEGGKNLWKGVISLAGEINSGSGNEWISFNGGGYLDLDSTTCFTRNDMKLDEIVDATRGFARASASMKLPIAKFKEYNIYQRAQWDMNTIWGIPKGGGFPIFRTLGGEFDDVPPYVSIPEVKKVNDLKVYAAGGNVVMEASQLASVWIYTLQGSLVERIDVDGTQSVALPHGVYIVKSAQNGNVKAVKIINR